MTESVPPGQPGLSWRVARSCESTACIRVAQAGQMIVLGDSKNPDGPVLRYTRAEWSAFADGVKQGDFDDLC